MENKPQRPNSYLALAIISTILCCLPTGIVSIIYATKVNSLYQDTNNYQPFQDDVEKKSLQDRFVELENEFRKYKIMMNTKNTSEEETIESFSNQSEGNDIQDLIVLIVLGLIIIFIMDNIFKLGKYIGAKGK